MKKYQNNTLKGLACSASAMALVISASAAAQDTQPAPVEEEEEQIDITEDAPAAENEGAIVVTGSRIRRDTYSSISPLQVLTTEASQEAGLFDPSQILQRSESASGTQIDATFNGFVLDNGPGSQTLNLRGLGADRTLLLVNGRRLGPAGVEGAPTSPSLNLLPGSLIERYDLLLDGASSVYGSDAVAGVGNVVLRKDFDGLELFARGELNPQGSGEDYTISAAYGLNTDRGFIGFGAEYDKRAQIRLSDRDFFGGCDRHRELTSTGEIRSLGIDQNANSLADSGGTIRTSESECTQNGFSGRIIIPFTNLGSVYLDPNGGAGNSGVPGFNESFFNGSPIDADGDGIRDVDFLNDQNTNNANPERVFLSEQKLFNVMAYGEYTFAGDANITPFFEANYTRAEIFADNTGAFQVFPNVPDSNAFNPCNPAAVGGVDCRTAEANTFGTGLGGIGAIGTRPVFAIRGDRTNQDIVQEQYRGVIGVRGDLPFISPSWTFETSLVYSRAEGSSNVRGVREDKLALALGIDPTMDFDGDGIFDNNGDGIADDYISGQRISDGLLQTIFGDPGSITPCDTSALANPNAALSDLGAGCVPVNLFAPSLLGAAIGDFATQAERDYVFGDRSFDTTYEQTTFSAFATGNLFDLPAGPVGAVIGAEYRKDKINSIPSDVASNGLFFGFFADSGAVGSKEIKEVFGEIDIPLQAGKPWVEELNVNFSGRMTDEEFYGTNFTYSVKAGWRPINPLLLKFSYGTSFRAPNLRENFLGSQTGFNTLFDPCAVPDDAFDTATGTYDPAQETREDFILANCRREGRDPTTAGLQIDPTTGQSLAPNQNASVEIARGGSLTIDPETSRSLTAGFAFEETFGDGWDVSLGLNYFDIKLKDSIISPSAQFILNDCYTRDDGQVSSFCDRITASSTGTQLVSDVFAGFINLNQENVRGLDLNATFGKEVQLFGTRVDLGVNVTANHLIERSNLFIGDDGTQTFDEDAGEFSLPKWTGRTTFTADVDAFRLTWQVRYVGPVEQDADGIDEFSDAFGRGPDGQLTGFTGNTCLGNGSGTNDPVTGEFTPDGVVAGTGVFCRDVGFAKEQFLHTASVRYRADGFTIIAGVDNIFNTAPPLVDGNEVTAIANTALGAGYDYDGREFFLSIRKEF
ncbi:TonB-dependent receptor [Altererythrobacter sp. RZ02]|uniref:TonB-dependent receptor n=1 Tax=Pontixanthobacter rizhaonensis TaxID=2730337 RepID=A0A848QKH5_9SPHN|nr:TonB-dependent receptor [Pontixanthobacter rizhaonensis]NMW31107.1 TonB-dependent receptor [Pontixanthobacter rizhaonensis]